jgi:hypothetical protein
VLSLIGVFVVAYIIDFLAGTFGARKSPDNAMRVSAYSPTAAWVAGVFNIIPALSFLGILGLYSLYLLYTGITGLMRPPSDKAVVYTIAVIVCAIIVWIVISVSSPCCSACSSSGQSLEMTDRAARRNCLCRRDDGVGIDAIVSIELGKRSGLSEMLDA